MLFVAFLICHRRAGQQTELLTRGDFWTHKEELLVQWLFISVRCHHNWIASLSFCKYMVHGPNSQSTVQDALDRSGVNKLIWPLQYTSPLG